MRDTIVNNYREEQFKHTFHMSRNMSKYVLENIQEGLQKQIITELPISPEVRLAICLYKLTKVDYYYTIREMTGIANL